MHASLQPEGKNIFAVKRLRRAIIDCELAPGSNPSEPEIASRFGLGRAAVRSALAQLAVDGFVSALPRNGWLVAPISGATIGDVVNARLALEPQLARAAVKSLDYAQLRELSGQLAALDGREEVEAIAAARVVDRKLILLVAAASGALVMQWVKEVLDHSARLLAYFEGGKIRYTASSREALIACLEAGDANGAADELTANVLGFKEYLVEQFLRSNKMTSAGDRGHSALASAPPKVSLQANRQKPLTSSRSKEKDQ